MSENTEMVVTDVVDDVVETNGNTGFGTAAKIGVSAIGGALLWEFACKPIWRGCKKLYAKRKNDAKHRRDDEETDDKSND